MDHSTQNEVIQTTQRDMFYDPPHTMTDHHFDLLFTGVMPIPESIGKWKAYQRYKDQGGIINYKEEIEIGSCDYRIDDMKEFWYKRFPETYDFVSPGFRCLIQGEAVVQATEVESTQQVIEITFEHCR